MAVTGIATAVVSGVGNIASGLISSNASKSAASAAQGYLSQALDFEKGVYSDATTNLTPWISGGQSALSQYEGGLGLGSTTGGTSGSSNLQSYWDAFTKTPYYTFPLNQSISSQTAADAAKGVVNSAGNTANIGKTAAGYASTNWGNYMDALNKLSGVGESAATSLGTIGTNISSQVSGTSSNQAGTASSGILGSASGTSQAISGLSQLLGGSSISGTGSGYGGSGGGNSGSSSSSGSGGLIGALSSLFSGSSNSDSAFNTQLTDAFNNVVLK